MAITKAVPQGDGWFQVVNRRRSNPPLPRQEHQWRSRWPKVRNNHCNWRGFSSQQRRGSNFKQGNHQGTFFSNGTHLTQRRNGINCAPPHPIIVGNNSIEALFPSYKVYRPSYRINEAPLSINGNLYPDNAITSSNHSNIQANTINSTNQTNFTVVMARKRNQAHNPSHSMHPPATNNTNTPTPPHPTANTNIPNHPVQHQSQTPLTTQANVLTSHSYAHAAASIHYQPIRPLNTTQRYQHPPWQHFMEHDPWQAPLSTNQPNESSPDPLPIPPEPNHPRWRGRCYNCLELGHDQNGCPSHERACANYWAKGHQAKNCPKLSRIEPMRPRGNLGEAGLPPNQPKCLNAFIPETNQMKLDALEFNRALVVDARLRPHHSLGAIQSVLMAT